MMGTLSMISFMKKSEIKEKKRQMTSEFGSDDNGCSSAESSIKTKKSIPKKTVNFNKNIAVRSA